MFNVYTFLENIYLYIKVLKQTSKTKPILIDGLVLLLLAFVTPLF